MILKTISRSVGNHAANLEADVFTVQALLNKCKHRLLPVQTLKEDGICGPVTVGVILEFQRRIMEFKNPDGRLDPAGKSLLKLNELTMERGHGSALNQHLVEPLLLQVQSINQPFSELSKFLFIKEKPAKKLTEQGYQKAATILGVDIATIKAVAYVESDGGGYLDDNRPKILFEGHWFSKFTQGKYDKTHPTISFKKWTKTHYVGGTGEYKRLQVAEALDKEAAWKSTSWGRFQIMGFNHDAAGYASVTKFVDAMKESEANQLLAFVKFLQSKKIDGYLKSGDWTNFAKNYNGPKYAENKYDIRLKQAYKAFSASK